MLEIRRMPEMEVVGRNALGVTQYGQMTAGSYMYIGPQGIVHGTTITLINAFRTVTGLFLVTLFAIAVIVRLVSA